jgi:putative ABC transport system permease protein
MWRAVLKNLRAHKGRLVRTTIAVVIGIAFISGTYVLTDTIRGVFNGIVTTSTSGVDVHVRGSSAFTSSGFSDRRPVPESMLSRIRAIPGVEQAAGNVGGLAPLVDRNGKVISNGGAPTLGFAWEPPPLSPLILRQGRAPQRAGEVAIDAATAWTKDFGVGNRIGVVLGGPVRPFTIVGIFGYGEAGNLAGATIATFDLKTAQSAFHKQGLLDSIEVQAAGGTSPLVLRERIGLILPSGFEAVSNTTVADEGKQSFDRFINIFQTMLLVFAAIALFVGAFIIFNTFSIIVAQRTKEFALLRALGASPGQVKTSVIGEAAVIGLVASGIGLAFGVVMAIGLQALLKGFGMDLPSSGLKLLARTVWVSVGLGVTVTVLSALSPARKAATVPPIAAIRDVASTRAGSLRRRVIVGAALCTTGAVAVVGGLGGWVPKGLMAVGVGALLVFVGVAMASPLIARPVTATVGALTARLGVSGLLARENAMRNPRRTATTASALTIGVALVAFVAILSSSVRASASSSLLRSLKADVAVTSSLGMAGYTYGFDPKVARLLAEQPAVGVVSEVRLAEWRHDGSTQMVAAVDPRTIGKVLDLDMRSGSIAGLSSGGVLIRDSNASDLGARVGDTLPMEFASTGLHRVPVVGTFHNGQALNSYYVVSLDTFERNFSRTMQMDWRIYVNAAPGYSQAALHRAVTAATDRFPNTKAMTPIELRDSESKQIDQILNLVTALLLLAVLIALIGIANTLGLSVMERTRELGLLRAVGMSRRQTRSMVRREAVIISVLGTVLGLALGVVFGWAVVMAMRDLGMTEFRIPGAQLAMYFLIAGLAGVVAALLPARRASRLDVLSAIATE